jgi:hypothetical protein
MYAFMVNQWDRWKLSMINDRFQLLSVFTVIARRFDLSFFESSSLGLFVFLATVLGQLLTTTYLSNIKINFPILKMKQKGICYRNKRQELWLGSTEDWIFLLKLICSSASRTLPQPHLISYLDKRQVLAPIFYSSTDIKFLPHSPVL